ncbi:MAG TPA: hypothetical protein VHD62_11155 [Opitutaceae bacterium]|nr:hypothetical protein [Opitutaceae bacterium]
MRKDTRNGQFRIRRLMVRDHGFRYATFQIIGYLDGERIRKKFKSRDEAIGERNRLAVLAANTDSGTRAINTRLTVGQVAEAESAFARLGEKSLSTAVEWFLTTYRPPVTQQNLLSAKTAFIADRKQHVRPMTLRDYEATLTDFVAFAANKVSNVHDATTGIVLDFLESRKVGAKRWNNLRGDLSAFFEWCKTPPRQWTRENPVVPVKKFKVVRSVPEIESAARLKDLFAFLETYTGDYGMPQPAGFLVPYFALATFAGLRPSVVEGEIFKIGQLADVSKVIDLDLGVIRVTPHLAKTKDVRQITIQPNMRQWLLNYPVRDFPICVPNLKVHVTNVRERWGLKGKDDVLRHTFISMHVAKFKSVGEAALQAGNSEAMLKRHYLNLVSESEAAEFWSIVPSV